MGDEVGEGGHVQGTAVTSVGGKRGGQHWSILSKYASKEATVWGGGTRVVSMPLTTSVSPGHVGQAVTLNRCNKMIYKGREVKRRCGRKTCRCEHFTMRERLE